MSMNYAYNYARIDLTTKMCMGVQSRTLELDPLPDGWVEIPVNDPEYVGKYYINGEWYEDAAGTIPWQSALL